MSQLDTISSAVLHNNCGLAVFTGMTHLQVIISEVILLTLQSMQLKVLFHLTLFIVYTRQGFPRSSIQ